MKAHNCSMPSIPPELIDDLEAILNEAVPENSDERVIQLRRHYRRAYAPWTPQEDEVLVRLSAAGFEAPDLVATLCRQDGAIRSRLSKLGVGGAPPTSADIGLLRVTPEMAAQSFPAWLEVVKAGGRVEVVQDGQVVASLAAPKNGQSTSSS